jgi:hypothetical protein
MSKTSDLMYHFCLPIYRNRLTLKERVKLYAELADDIGLDDYDIRKNNIYVGIDYEKASKDLQRCEKEVIRQENAKRN